VIVYNFDEVGVTVPPFKTDTPLSVDADTPLPFALAGQLFEAVPWRMAKVAHILCVVNGQELVTSAFLNVFGQLLAVLAPKLPFASLYPRMF
jgi:hypothetical protein